VNPLLQFLIKKRNLFGSEGLFSATFATTLLQIEPAEFSRLYWGLNKHLTSVSLESFEPDSKSGHNFRDGYCEFVCGVFFGMAWLL